MVEEVCRGGAAIPGCLVLPCNAVARLLGLARVRVSISLNPLRVTSMHKIFKPGRRGCISHRRS